jgi:hypothetical protein
VRQCVYLLRWLVAVDIIVEVGVAEWGGGGGVQETDVGKKKRKRKEKEL